MKMWRLLLCICLVQSASAAEPRTSGNVYLSPQLQALQNDVNRNPIALWLDRGQNLWQAQCQSCHGNMDKLKTSVVSFPRLSVDGKTLRNLEDQIAICQQRASKTGASTSSATQTRVAASNENDEVLALSAALHHTARTESINVAAPATQQSQWQARLANGQQIYQSRMGRINLACMHCHDQKVGAQMRADTISQGHPTGFPIYRMNWQTLGSTERRLRACYSGVQAPIPDPGSADLRDLELFLKVRANGMPLDGPSIRR